MRAMISILFLILVCNLHAGGPDAIYETSVRKPMEEVYSSLYKSLEASRFYVIFEANIGKNLARNAEKWGDDYNRNKYEEVRSMIICNPYYANQVMNLDPRMMALCPMNVTVLHKEGNTTILFERLLPVAAGSPAEDILWEVENTIISAIETVTAE